MSDEQAPIAKNLGNYPRFLKSSNDFQFATAVRTPFDVDIEYSFAHSSPAMGNRHDAFREGQYHKEHALSFRVGVH